MKNSCLTLCYCLCLLLSINNRSFAQAKTPATSENTDDRSEAAEADQLYRQGKVQDAQRLYSKNIDKLTASQKVTYATSLVATGSKQYSKLAFEFLYEALLKGDSTALAPLGKLYLDGTGTKKDSSKALALLNSSIQLKAAAGYYYMGVYHYRNKAYREAKEYYLKSAALNYAIAMNELGVMYQNGKGVAANRDTAIQWFKKSAELGHGLAYANIGWIYFNNGKVTDIDSAYNNFRRALEYGDAKHTYALGLGHCLCDERSAHYNIDSAVHYYKIAGENNKARGYSRIGYLFENGTGMKRNIDSAIFFYGKGVQGKDTWANLCLANIFNTPEFEKKNEHLSFKLLQSCADMGDLSCKIELALYYFEGIGTAEDTARCVEMLEAPDLADDTDAQYRLALVKFKLGQEEAALVLLQRSADKDNSNAMIRLALYYLYRGAEKQENLIMYNKWLDKAVVADNADALYFKGSDYYFGLNCPKDTIKGMEMIARSWKMGNKYAREFLDNKFITLNKNNEFVHGKIPGYDAIDYTKDYEKPEGPTADSAMKGYAPAQYALGLSYLYGTSVPKNPVIALRWLRQSASKGYVESYLTLADMYYRGFGVQKNYLECKAWLELAAEKNNDEAIALLADCYYKGEENIPKDIPKALELYKKASSLNNSRAPHKLAYHYLYHSDSTRDNKEEGIKWMTLAAERGHADAQFSMGFYYLNGELVKQNDSLGIIWAKKAAEQNEVSSMMNLALYYEQHQPANDTMAIYWAKKAARLGDAEGILYLKKFGYDIREVIDEEHLRPVFDQLKKAVAKGRSTKKDYLLFFYYYGLGTATDYNQAFSLAAELYNEGLFNEVNMAMLYLGKEIPDYIQSGDWFLKAAQKGDTVSAKMLTALSEKIKITTQYNFSKFLTKQAVKDKALYMADIGLSFLVGSNYAHKNITEGMFWLEKAAQAGFAEAQVILGNIYSFGQYGILMKNEKQAKFWLEKAAVQGNAAALNNLGECYYIGLGVKKDFSKARFYYQQAADKGLSMGNVSLGTLYLNGEGVAKDPATARKLFESACNNGLSAGCIELAKIQ